MKNRYAALLLVTTLAANACGSGSVTPTTLGVDDAPQIIKNTFLTVTRQAATLAGYTATSEEWMDFAREVCTAGIKSPEELTEFVNERAGSESDPFLREMWATAAGAATTSFCPIGRA